MNQTTCTLLTPEDYATTTILNEVCVKCIIFLNDLRLSFFFPFYYFAYLIEDHFRCNIGQPLAIIVSVSAWGMIILIICLIL